MNTEEQRIAIAKACGWESKNLWHPCDGHCNDVYCEGYWKLEETPDYLNDLNAMHEAEKFIDDELVPDWIRYLLEVCRPDDWQVINRFTTHETCLRATASQRAEAFLKTLGLWKE